MSHWEIQLRKGVVMLVVLAPIARGETYGYHIVEQLRGLSGLALTKSTVYPVLTRDGALGVRTEASSAGPSRHYYRLTADGETRFVDGIK